MGLQLNKDQGYNKVTSNPRFIVAVDPGTGVKSPLGLVIFDPVSRDISMMECLTSTSKNKDVRIKAIADAFTECLSSYGDDELMAVYIETFVMRGVGGATLQQMIGAVIGRVPTKIPIKHVNCKVVKAVVGGHGEAEKDQVANGVSEFFKWNTASSLDINRLIDNENWDLLDAFAIGIAGIKA